MVSSHLCPAGPAAECLQPDEVERAADRGADGGRLRRHIVDFSTCDPARVRRYRSVSREELLRDLAAAQRHLTSTVVDVPDGDLARAGCHEFDGEVSLTGILVFLPRHQADHADQLELLG